MKHLRQYIRQILLETPEMQDELDQFVHNRESPAYSKAATHHREKQKEITARKREEEKLAGTSDDMVDELFPTDEQIDAKFDLRRDVKKFWNENADHKFWQNPDRVIAIHDLGYYAELEDEGEAEFVDDLSQDHDLKLEAFLKKYPPGIKQKDEMSTYGFIKDSQRSMSRSKRFNLAIILNPRRITYASTTDAFSESRGGASEADLERHKGSGLPKRPSVSKYFRGKGVLFDREDVHSTQIGELIVDNWSYDTILINSQQNEYFSQDRIEQIIELAKDYGLKVLDVKTGKEL